MPEQKAADSKSSKSVDLSGNYFEALAVALARAAAGQADTTLLQWGTFAVSAEMHDGSERRATIYGQGATYILQLADATRRARLLFPRAAFIHLR